jgi:hypothetical protein
VFEGAGIKIGAPGGGGDVARCLDKFMLLMLDKNMY